MYYSDFNYLPTVLQHAFFFTVETGQNSWYNKCTTGWMSKELWFNPWHEQEISLFFKASGVVLGPTQSPVQYISVHFSQRV
jgi:hypothetical protein